MRATTHPLVSVIIPTYKGKATLSRAIESCLNQSYKPIEIIIVDDNTPGSIDRRDTEELMSTYQSSLKILYYKHPANLNGSAARNTGFRHAHGTYISLLDDDDYFDKDKILKQVDFLESHAIFAAATCTAIRNGAKLSMKDKHDYTEEILRAEGSPVTPSLVIRREAYAQLGGFDESYRRHQDYEFLLRFFLRYKIGLVKEAKVYICTDGTDNRPSAEDFERIKSELLKQFSHIINSRTNSKQLRKSAYSAKYNHLLFAYAKEGKISDVKRMFREGVAVDGLHFCGEILRYCLNYAKQKVAR